MKFSIIIKELKTHQEKHGSDSSEKEQSFIIDLLFFTLEKNKETELSRQELLDFAKLLFKHQDLAETKNLSKTFTFFFSRLISNSVGDDYYFAQPVTHHPQYGEIDPVFRRNYLDSLRRLNENQRLDLYTFEAFNQYARQHVSYWPVVSENMKNIVEKPHLTNANLEAIFNTKQSFLLTISRLMTSQFPIDQQRFDQLYRMSEQDRRFILYILLNGPKLNSNEATMTLEEFGQLIDLVDEKHNPCPADELKYIYHLSAYCDIYHLENLRLLLDASIQTKSQVYKLTELINTCLKSTNDKVLFSRTVILMLHNITLWGHICDTLKKNGFYAYTNPHCDDPRSSWFKLERIAHELQDETCQNEGIKAQLKSKLGPLCSAQTYRVMRYQEVSDALSEYDDNRKHQGEQQIAGSYINLKQLADNIKPYTLITSLKEFCADRDLSKTMDERARYSLAHTLLSDDHQGRAATLYAVKSRIQKKLIAACTDINIDEQPTSHIHFFDTLALMQSHGLLSEDSFFAYTAACQSVNCEAWVTMKLAMRTLETNHLFNNENLHQLCIMANPPSLRALYLFSSAQLAFGQEDFDHLMRLNDNKLAIFLQVLERFEMDIKAQQRGEDAKYQLSRDDLLRFLSYLSAEVANERCIEADDFDSAIIQLNAYTDMMQLERLKQVLDAPICTGNMIYRTTLLLDLLKALGEQSGIIDPITVILLTIEHWADHCENESNFTEMSQLLYPDNDQASDVKEQILQSRSYRLLSFINQLPAQTLQTMTKERFALLSDMGMNEQVAHLSTVGTTEQKDISATADSARTEPCEFSIKYSPTSARDLKLPFLSEGRPDTTANVDSTSSKIESCLTRSR